MPADLLKSDSNTGVSCEFCKTVKSICFVKHLRTDFVVVVVVVVVVLTL